FFTDLQKFPTLAAVKLHHVFDPAPERFTAQSAPAALDALGTFRTRFDVLLSGIPGVRSTAIVTSLDSILRNVLRQLGVLAQPLYIVAAQIVGLVLLFVVAMTALLMERQSGELATLKSRGASASQMVASLTLQSLPIAAIAAAAGLVLAPILARLLVH